MPENDSGVRPETGGGVLPEGDSGVGPEGGGEEAAPGENGTIRRFVEDKIPTGLWVRVFVYVVAAHGVAAFLYLLFVLGAKNQ
ncbi:DUF6126 family protein [Streptomyces sp. P6-2-1]|uniref:DUF6126 family protein n=1 Tax=unclassified Streptomyces TaxID=2593676 RepID=UPI003D364FFB